MQLYLLLRTLNHSGSEEGLSRISSLSPLEKLSSVSFWALKG